jgi:hypothetical protein
MKIVIAFSVSLTLIANGICWAAPSTAVEDPTHYHDQIENDLNSTVSRFRNLASTIDRSHFDPESLLEATDYESDRIIDYVKHQIRFQAYKGTLRGPRGTLISQAGNSIDQSLLLANLLKNAGYEARIVRGEISKDLAAAEIRSMGEPQIWPAAFDSSASLGSILEKISTKSHQSVDAISQDLNVFSSALQTKSDQIASTVTRLNNDVALSLGDRLAASEDQFADRLINEQTDYFWVQYREGVSGVWVDVHPAIPDIEELKVDPSDYYADAIPEDLAHRVQIQVYVETNFGDQKATHELMSTWERTAANNAYEINSLAIMPITDFTPNDELDLDAALEEADFFGVYLNGSLAPGAKVFTLEGLIGPPDALTAQGSFFANVASKGMTAIDILSNLDVSDEEKESGFGLNRLWIEYTLLSPGGETKVETREILGTASTGEKIVQGQVVRDQELNSNLKTALIQNRQIMFATGPVNPAFSVSRNLEYIDETVEALKKLEEFEEQGELSASSVDLRGVKASPDFRPLEFLGKANASTGFEGGLATYLAEPMLVTVQSGLSKQQADYIGFRQTDIVFNSRRSIEWDGSEIRRSVRQAARHGILDTYLELSPMDASSGSQSSAFEILSAQDKELKYISPTNPALLRAMNLGVAEHELAIAELESGNGLLIAHHDEGARPGWWRVDPGSGTVTGMTVGPGGYGGTTATEYGTILSIGITLIFLAMSVAQCFLTEAGLALFCCLVDSYITGVLVAALAFVIGALIGTVVAGGFAGMTATEAIFTGASVSGPTQEMVAAIAVFLLTDVPGVAVSLSGFTIRVCGRMTED